jgi:DNA repair protein RecO (recombination protein O)
MPLYSADALILRTYKLGEADRIVVFLTRDRGKKRGVAKGARRQKSNFVGALEPLTHARVAYFEKERRELVNLNYSEASRSALSSGTIEGLGCATYFAELIDEWAAESHEDERLYRLGVSMVEAIASGVPSEPLTRYFEYWLLSLQGVYPAGRVASLSPEAQAFLAAARKVGPQALAGVTADRAMLRELESLHRSIIATHLEREPRSIKVLKDMTRL